MLVLVVAEVVIIAIMLMITMKGHGGIINIDIQLMIKIIIQLIIKIHIQLMIDIHMSKCRLIRMNLMTYLRSVNTSIIGVF